MLKIAEAAILIDDAVGKQSGPASHEELHHKKQRLFAAAQIKGSVSMLSGGGAAPLDVLIETVNGLIVRVSLGPREARKLAAAILTHAGDE